MLASCQPQPALTKLNTQAVHADEEQDGDDDGDDDDADDDDEGARPKKAKSSSNKRTKMSKTAQLKKSRKGGADPNFFSGLA